MEVSKMVPPVRLELTHRKVIDFESIVSTNSTTEAIYRWGMRWDSNPRPTESQPATLTS